MSTRDFSNELHDGAFRAFRRRRPATIMPTQPTGAGVGGIVDGKKGALIGGALGGGAGSLYEGAPRR